MFGPVQAGGDEFEHGRIDDVNGAGEAPRQAPAHAAGEGRAETFEMFEHLPEQILGQGRIALAVGVGKAVAAGRSRAAHGRERPRVQAQAVADVIEPDGVGELRVEQRDDLAPRTEGTGLGLDAVLAGQCGDEMIGNEIAELAQEREFGTGWLRAFGIIHPCRVAGDLASANPFLFSLWDGCA